MATGNVLRRLDEVDIPEITLVNSDEKYNALGEKDVKLLKLSLFKDGKEYEFYRVEKEGQILAIIDKDGRINLKNDYLGELKLANADYYKTLGLDDLDRSIKKIDIDKEFEKNKDKTKGDKKVKKNEEKKLETKKEEKNNQDIKVAKIEEDLELPKDDIVSCTQIRDARFYKEIPEARNHINFSLVAYSKSRNDFIIVSPDENGKLDEIKSIEHSRSKLGTMTEVDKEGVSQKAIGQIMPIKNSKDAFSIQIDPNSTEIKLQEIRYDDYTKQYMAAELYTSTQRPTKEEVSLIDKVENPEISDELKMIEEYKKAGYNKISIEKISEKNREKYQILDESQIEQMLEGKEDSVKRVVKSKIKKMENVQITAETVDDIIEDRKSVV